MKNIPTLLVCLALILINILGLKFFNQSAAFFTFFYLSTIFIPGYLLGTFFEEKESLLQNVMEILVLGFLFNFFVALLAIFLSLNIIQLINFYGLLMAIIIVLNILVFVKKKPFLKIINPKALEKPKFNINWHFVTLLVIPLALVFIFCALNQQGVSFKGDPQYHLATVNKVVSGEKLTVDNLNYIKDTPMLLYLLPAWHVQVGLVSKITGFDIFDTWNNLMFPLTLILALIWYYLAVKVLPNRNMAVLAVLFFLSWLFAQEKGYLFGRLMVPDTFNQYLFLPLAVALTLDLIFHKTKRNLWLVYLFVLIMAINHFTQYFYYLLLMGAFLVVFAVTQFKTEQYRLFLKKIIISSFGTIAFILPLLLIWQLKSQAVLKNVGEFMDQSVQAFKMTKFKEFDLFAQVSFVLSPLLLLLVRRYQALIFLFGSIALAALVLFTPLKLFLAKIFSFVFINRFFYNVTWYYLFWGMLLGLVVLVLNYFYLKIDLPKKLVKYLNITVVVVAAVIVYLNHNFRFLLNWYETLFTQSVSEFIKLNLIWILATIIVLTVIAWFKGRNFKIDLSLKATALSFSLVLIIALMLFMPDYRILKNYFVKERASGDFFRANQNAKGRIISYGQLGSKQALQFVSENIPPKRVFDTNGNRLLLPVVLDQHMTTYQSQNQSKYDRIYDSEVSLEEKIKILKLIRAEYLYIVYAKVQNQQYFDRYPYFVKKYAADAVVYQIDWQKINADFPQITTDEEFVPYSY